MRRRKIMKLVMQFTDPSVTFSLNSKNTSSLFFLRQLQFSFFPENEIKFHTRTKRKVKLYVLCFNHWVLKQGTATWNIFSLLMLLMWLPSLNQICVSPSWWHQILHPCKRQVILQFLCCNTYVLIQDTGM